MMMKKITDVKKVEEEVTTNLVQISIAEKAGTKNVAVDVSHVSSEQGEGKKYTVSILELVSRGNINVLSCL